MRYGIAESALKRDYPYSDLLRIARTGDYLGPIRDGLIWWVGELSDGLVIEMAGFAAIIICHTQPMGWRMK